jgi:hypothetical protein
MACRVLLPAIFILLTACASAPVQEMSDARQALRSAEEAGAVRYSPDRYNAAQRSLQTAQMWLDRGAYTNARRHALDARDQAIQAREDAAATSPP